MPPHLVAETPASPAGRRIAATAPAADGRFRPMSLHNRGGKAASVLSLAQGPEGDLWVDYCRQLYLSTSG